VNRFVKFALVLAFFAAIFAVNLHAQPAPQPAVADAAVPAATPAAAQAEAAVEPTEEKIPPAPSALFTIPVLGLPITNSMVCTWIVAGLILIIVRATTWKNIKEVPSGMQNAMEALVESWDGLMGDILDERVTRWVFPFATTFFIFIVMSNFVDLIPGVGSIGFTSSNGTYSPLFRPPTTDANLTMAMSGIFLVMSLYWAIRYNGVWGLVKHVFGVKMETNKWLYPLFLLLFIFIGAMESMSILIIRPVALAMRLYGNIFGGENVIDTMIHNKSFLLSVLTSLPFYFYEVFVCLLQAFVFALLVVAFVGTLCQKDEDHGH